MFWLNYVLTTTVFAYTFHRLKYDVNNIYSYNDSSIQSSSSSSFKQQKESFVSGHTGTSPFENVILCSVAPIGVFFYLECRSRFIIQSSALSSSQAFFLHRVLEYMTILLPMVWSQSFILLPWGICVLFIQFLVAQILSSGRRRERHARNHPLLLYRQPVITCYRATVLYMTCIAILAVDFQIFPRRYAKTETHGYGLMDLGTGSFIFSSALVSSFAKGIHNRNSHSMTSDAATTTASSLTDFKTFLMAIFNQRSIPLLLLGLIRLLSNKGLEYPEHDTEYGIHWNFFFTLVLVLNTAYFIRYIFRIYITSFPIFLLLLYQYFLSHGGQVFIEQAPRWLSHTIDSRTRVTKIDAHGILLFHNLFLANREGILGCVGYLCLFLISEHIGSFCLWDCKKIGYPLEARFLSVSSILWTLHWFLTSILHIPVSRRSTNATYILWVMAQNTLQLFFFSTVFTMASGSQNQDPTHDIPEIKTHCPPIFESINRHGLFIFILANLMTGLINLTINTMTCSIYKSFTIMIFYSMTLVIMSLVMDSIRRLFFHRTGNSHKG